MKIDSRMSSLDTLPKLLAHNARIVPEGAAIREKTLGIWKPWSWADYERKVRDIALGLREIGIGTDDVVAIIGDNRPYWICAEIAIQATGATSLGLYRDSLEDEIYYLLDLTRTRVVVAEDEEQVDKLLGLIDRLPSLKTIVYADPRGIRKLQHESLLSIDQLTALGTALHSRQPGLYSDLLERENGSRPTILCPTSGTTANPKLAMLSQRALIGHARTYLRADPRDAGDDYVSILPLAWIMEQVYALAEPLLARMVVNFAEEPSTMMEDLREIGPSFVLFAPRQWEQIAAEIQVRVEDGGVLKRLLYRVGRHFSAKALEKGKRSIVGDTLVNRALRDRLGLSKLKSAATGGAALGPETFRFFQSLGIPLRQLYGQTELIGAYMMHRPEDIDQETVGLPFDASVEVQIVEPDANGLGEIVARHPNMFCGYFRNEQASRADMRDGWFNTGDAGYFNGKGHLVVVDRVRDLVQLRDGTRYSPQYLENKLKFSSNIAEAVVVSDGANTINALLCIRYAVVSRWAERRGIAFTTYADLAANKEVTDLIRREVERVNKTLPMSQRISQFVLLYKELDADDGELTRTRKLRRNVIGERYEAIIEAMNQRQTCVHIDTTIALQDGGRQRVEVTLDIVRCNHVGA